MSHEHRSTIDPDRLARLRAICLALPDATEKRAWGDPTWRIRDKIFAMQKGNHAGGSPSVWVKAPEGEQAELVAANPDVYFVPPYVGQHGWIGLVLDDHEPDWAVVTRHIEASYRLVAPKGRRRRADATR